ncbi:unnamed protein product [Mycena citricolor]|uniref:Uncharacterized protein n=1 Tax=Mycena citricolor TaxID=2018698 RepID=A0AAD2H2A7_9AGAR|nr:unnamed protein product [Mycena citricolor]
MVHGSSQRELQERFQRSGDTISCYLNHRLLALTGTFYKDYIRAPADKTPDQILTSELYYPFFKYCRGTVDGVHILAYALAHHLT